MPRKYFVEVNDEDSYSENEEILNENKDNLDTKKREAFSALARFFEHTLKYKHQPSNQESSWAQSISNAMIELEDKTSNTNVRNHVIGNFEKAYNEGMKLMNGKTHLGMVSETEVKTHFDTLDKVLNRPYVKKWLQENHNPAKRDFLENW